MLNRIVSLAVLLLVCIITSVEAQVIRSGTISTAGADCSTTTRCSELIDVRGVPSFSITLDVATSGTYNFEYTNDSVGSVSQTSATVAGNVTKTVVWTALTDDVNAASTLTADGTRFFTNPGYQYVRVRASAINGTGSYIAVKGFSGLKSTATLSGGGDASAANQTTGNAYLATLAGGVAGTEFQVDCVSGCGAGTQDTDDASIAAGQTTGLSAALLMGYDGSVWRRLTFGTAGTASSQVLTIQGIASMTPILATLSGTNTITAVTAITNALPAGTNNIGDVDVLTLPAIPAGTNNIGDVDVLSVAAGDNNIGNVDIVSMPADATELPAAVTLADNTANPTLPGVASFSMCWDGANWDRCSGSSADTELPTAATLADNTANPSLPAIAAYNMCYDGTTWDRCQDSAIPAGNNNIGDVDVASIAAGDNNIGNVDIVTLPALAAGTNNIGDVDVLSIAAGDNNIGNVDIVTLPAIPAGTNNIGDVDVLTLPALPTGTNSIGQVTGASSKPIVACDSVAVIDTAASGNTQLVAISGSTVIYVCSYSLTAEATVDVRLVRGTGTACATGETSITGTYAFSTTTGMLGLTRGSGIGMVTKGNSGDAVCIETSGAVQINGEITYAQY